MNVAKTFTHKDAINMMEYQFGRSFMTDLVWCDIDDDEDENYPRWDRLIE